jgi:hypothetical protein
MTPKESKDAIDKKIAEEKKKLDAIEERLNDDTLKDDAKKKLQGEKDEIINMIAGKNIVWEIVAIASSATVSQAKIDTEILGEFTPTGVTPTKETDEVKKGIKEVTKKFDAETDAKKKRELRKHIEELQKILGKLEALKAGGFS